MQPLHFSPFLYCILRTVEQETVLGDIVVQGTVLPAGVGDIDLLVEVGDTVLGYKVVQNLLGVWQDIGLVEGIVLLVEDTDLL